MARLIRSLLMLGMVYVLATASFCPLCEFDERFCPENHENGPQDAAPADAPSEEGTASQETGAIQ